MNGAMQTLELLYLLVRKELRVRYKSSVLGYLWALANPFAFAFVYWMAFKYIMRVQMENYSLYLITGIFPWVWLSSGITQATRSFHTNSPLVKKVRMPYAIIPLTNVVQEMVHFVLTLPIIMAFLWFGGDYAFNPAWLWQVPLMMLVQLALVYPPSLIFALWNVYVHDIEHLVALAFALLFFLTPMVYPIEMVPAELRPYFAMNPLHSLIEAWRSVFLRGAVSTTNIAHALAFAAVLGALAGVMYRRMKLRLGELL